MPLPPETVEQSEAVWKAWTNPQPPATEARMTLTGFRGKDSKHFFNVLSKSTPPGGQDICEKGPEVEDYAKYDYAAWFNYFYKEAQQALPGEQSATFFDDLARMYAVMFDLSVTGAGNAAVIAPASSFPVSLSDGFKARLNDIGDPVPRQILQFLFELGFAEATTTTAGDYLGKMLGLKSNLNDGAKIRSQKDEFVFGYRGDTRKVQTIKDQNGATCRADLDFWRKESNLDKHWHPWKDATDNWEKMWFRKGAKDNDYFTMNSIAKDFHIACAYPMFKAFEIDSQLKGPADTWEATLQKKLEPKKIVLRDVYNTTKSKWETVPRDETRIFVCAFNAKKEAAKTYELNEYPETAVRNVALEDMIAYIRVHRYHHFPGDGQIYYQSTLANPAMTIRVMSWSWFRTEEETRAYLGCTHDGIKVISAKMQNLVGKMFDITHATYHPTATLQVNRSKTPKAAPKKDERVRLTAR